MSHSKSAQSSKQGHMSNRNTQECQKKSKTIIQKKQKTSSNIPIEEFYAQVNELMLESRAIIESKDILELKKEQLIETQNHRGQDILGLKAAQSIKTQTPMDEDVQINIVRNKKSKNNILDEDEDVLNADDMFKQFLYKKQYYIKDQSEQITYSEVNQKKQKNTTQTNWLTQDAVKQITNQKTNNNNKKNTNKFQALENDLASLQRNEERQAANTPGRLNKRLKRKGDCQLQVAQEDLDQCSICYASFESQEVAALPCKHLFCFACILKLGQQYKNECPFCRKKFNYVTKGLKMKDGDFIKKDCIMIKLKRQLTPDDTEQYSESSLASEADGDDSFIDNDSNCQYCLTSCEDKEEFIRCKTCKVHFSHSYCIPGHNIQYNDWICKFCK